MCNIKLTDEEQAVVDRLRKTYYEADVRFKEAGRKQIEFVVGVGTGDLYGKVMGKRTGWWPGDNLMFRGVIIRVDETAPIDQIILQFAARLEQWPDQGERPAPTDNPYYPFRSEGEELTYRNAMTETICDMIINWKGHGVCGSAKLQHIKEVYRASTIDWMDIVEQSDLSNTK